MAAGVAAIAYNGHERQALPEGGRQFWHLQDSCVHAVVTQIELVVSLGLQANRGFPSVLGASPDGPRHEPAW